VRPAGTEANEQVRAGTPGQAIREGATYVVVGRPVLGATDRRAAAEAIVAEIAAASN
jgi:orotidine-5'-phosphate decarboxylase